MENISQEENKINNIITLYRNESVCNNRGTNFTLILEKYGEPVMDDLFVFFFFFFIVLFWVNEWLLFNANSVIFQLYYGENKLIFNEMVMKSALY